MARSLLVVDDDSDILASMSRALTSDDRSIRTAESAERALALLAETPPDLLITDVRLPGMSGLELLQLVRERASGVDVMLMSAFDDLPTVAVAMREGAVDFLVKPLDLHGLRAAVARVLEDRGARSRAGGARRAEAKPAVRLAGRNPRMLAIFKMIGQVAGTRTNVLIRGESGTGKELIARAIHEHSPYAAEPFVAVNCTALPATLLESELFGHVRGSFTGAASDRRGRFALASRGTIFLDEIGDTPPEFQAKLLRVLQEHEYYPVGAERPQRADARVIAATHRDLEALIPAGEFRADLYYRLRVVEIAVPPLRQRRDDIPLLAEHLLARAAGVLGRQAPVLTSDALDLLLAHEWRGNVRELENCLVRALVLVTGDVIRAADLALASMPAAASSPRLTTLEQVEREHVAATLRATGGHRARTAAILGVSRPRLRRLLGKYGLGGDAANESPDTDSEAT